MELRARIAMTLSAAALLAGASGARADDTAAPPPPAKLSYLGFDEASYTDAGREGLREIYSGRMFHAAIPFSLVKSKAAADAKMKDKLGYDPSSPEGDFYANGRVPSPPERGADPEITLSLCKFERDGAVVVSGNCFECHAGVVNGVVVAGLGNSNVMQKTSKTVSARGDNYGQYAVWSYASKVADPAKTGLRTSGQRTELTALVDDAKLPPVQPMPWWLMKYKVRDYWYGDGGPADAAHFSLNFTMAHPKVNESHAAHVASTAKALAFARETQSPLFPGSLDPALVELGADLFHGRKEPAATAGFKACYQCHGTYAKKKSHPDLAKPGSWSVDYDGSEALRDVGTDPEYNELIKKFKPIIEHLSKLKEYYEAQGTPELYPHDNPLEGKGYVPPPLVGVWATAPYLHNGSAPTIESVLDSKTRPEIWARSQSPHAYDLKRVGVEYAAVTREEYDASAQRAAAAHARSKAAIDHMFIYDTLGFGHGKMGHTFGDSLSAEERAAIIEFLKSLSGPDM